VGGFDLALERNGVKVVATCEIDKHAQKILTRHFPNAKLFSDVSTLTGKELLDAGFDPENGIITGGFPCQDVSVAGKRAGLTRADGTHTRSGLFWEVIRILQETKAQYFILENVPGLLSSNNGRDFGTVIGALDELGYEVAWRILDAQYFGVPQRRRRIFIVGSLGNNGVAPSEILALGESSIRDFEASLTKGKATTGKVAPSSGSNQRLIGNFELISFPQDALSLSLSPANAPMTPSHTKSVANGELVGALQASDYKFPQQQQAHENKIVIQ